MDISAMDPKDIPGLFDAEVVGPDGEKVGTIQQIFADEVTGAVTFVTVLSEGHEHFIPVRGADYSTSHVSVPFNRDIIETAPEASEEDDLSRDREAEVYGHYGMEPARRSGLEIDDDDIIIAQPGRSPSTMTRSARTPPSLRSSFRRLPVTRTTWAPRLLRMARRTTRTVLRRSAMITPRNTLMMRFFRSPSPCLPWVCRLVPSCAATSSLIW